MPSQTPFSTRETNDHGRSTRQQPTNLRHTLSNLTPQQQEAAANTPHALPNEAYLLTSRARQPPIDILPRTIIKLHHPINLKALALLRSGIGRNLISLTLIQQLNLIPYATELRERDPFFGTPLPNHGAIVLRVAVADDSGEEREREVRFLVTRMQEDVVFGVEWMCAADVIMGASTRVFRWNDGSFGEDEEDEDGGEGEGLGL